MTPVAEMVGSNRIVAGHGICTPLGDAERSPAEERALRRALLERALQLLATPMPPQGGS
jgi:betaine reductase